MAGTATFQKDATARPGAWSLPALKTAGLRKSFNHPFPCTYLTIAKGVAAGRAIFQSENWPAVRAP